MRFSLICVLAFSKKPSTAVLGDKSGREKHLLHHCWTLDQSCFTFLHEHNKRMIVSGSASQNEQSSEFTVFILKSLLFKKRILLRILYWKILVWLSIVQYQGSIYTVCQLTSWRLSFLSKCAWEVGWTKQLRNKLLINKFSTEMTIKLVMHIFRCQISVCNSRISENGLPLLRDCFN